MPPFTMTRLRSIPAKSGTTLRPRVVPNDRTGHAARSTTTPDELTPLEGDDGTLGVADLLLSRQERHRRHDRESHLFHLAKGSFVARIGSDEPGPHRREVASRGPLLALLDRPAVSSDEDRLEREAAQAQRREDIRHLLELSL